MQSIPVIAIDGPSGSGKGSVAGRVSKALGYHLLDSGVLYRVLGLAARLRNVDLQQDQAVAELARTLDIAFGENGPGSVSLDGKDVSIDIRTSLGSDMASRVGAIPAARAALLERQLMFRQAPGLVADGRDMGTVVFPDAAVKIFLTASVEERAQRRYKQLIAKGIDAILSALLSDLKERDERDRERAVSPLLPATDAEFLDTTEMSEEATVLRVLELVQTGLPNP
jgi:cytidylate kinase